MSLVWDVGYNDRVSENMYIIQWIHIIYSGHLGEKQKKSMWNKHCKGEKNVILQNKTAGMFSMVWRIEDVDFLEVLPHLSGVFCNKDYLLCGIDLAVMATKEMILCLKKKILLPSKYV